VQRRPRFSWTDHTLELFVGHLLRAGVLIAAAVAVLGGLLYLTRDGSALVDYRTFRGEPQALRSVSGTVAAVLQGNTRALMQLGLLLLIATPIARVALSLVGFAKGGDWRYVAITTLVLVLLLFSLLGTRP
jgi:uncharacterized membrane protein